MKEVLLLPLKVLLIAIDLLITLLTFGWIGAFKKFIDPPPLHTIPVGDDKSHRVKVGYKNNLTKTPQLGYGTLYDLVRASFQKNGSHDCMTSREFLGWKVPGKVKEYGEKKVLSFADVGVLAHKFGSALRAAKVMPAPDTTSIDKVKETNRIAIFENTCPQWMIAAIGAFSQSITVTTVYATLGMDAVVEAIQDNLISVLVCNARDVAKVAAKRSSMRTLTHIVYTNDLVAPNDKIDLPTVPGLTIVSFDDFVASGNTTAYPPTPPKADTAAVVMYTSGSTGKPKGVIINHAQIVACGAAVEVAIEVQPGVDVYLGYLPLAHIMELMAEFALLAVGCSICYADPKSLSNTGAYPTGALEAYSPTMMVAVPKIWDTIKKGIQAQVAQRSPVAQFLVKTAFEWRNFALKNGFDTPLFKAIIFKKMTAAVGGKLRFGLSGGGPLNEEVQDFIRCAFGIQIVQGYGLTETCAGVTMQDLHDMRGRIAGVALASVEVKLDSTPEILDRDGKPYLSTDSVDVEGNVVFGRGEVCVRGNNISCGYYMEPEKTREEYRENGWFHTGDIGQFMSDGSIRIVDRKKNLVKLKGGEYIALENMEMVYGNSTFVDAVAGGICCYGDGDMDRSVAILQLSEAYTMRWAKEKGISGQFSEIRNSKELYDAVMQDMLTEHGKSDLSQLEKLVAVTFVTDPWTPENGCLTAANKLQRREVVKVCGKEFDAIKSKGIF